MSATVMLEDFSEPRYREPVATPCEVLSRVRVVNAPVRNLGRKRQVLEWGLVRVRVAGESEPRDVSACRVAVDGAALWPRRA